MKTLTLCALGAVLLAGCGGTGDSNTDRDPLRNDNPQGQMADAPKTDPADSSMAGNQASDTGGSDAGMVNTTK